MEEGELVEGLVVDLADLMEEETIADTHLVYQDNQPTIKIVTDAGSNLRSKYMKVRAAYVAERLGTGEVAIKYIPTSKMVADLLTKPLGGDLFHRHANMALGRLPAMRNRGAERIMVDKRTSTCAQPVNECRMRQGHVEGVCDTRTSVRSGRA
jgi:hypothetical protein